MSTRSGPWLDVGLELQPSWPKIDDRAAPHRDVAGVAIGNQDSVHLFTRNDAQVLVYGRDGDLQHSFGYGLFTMPHAIEVDPDGCIYCVDNGDHTVRKFSPAGELLLTLGTPTVGSDTGWRALSKPEIEISAVEAVQYPGEPFNGCTDVGISDQGDIYVSDGYRNCQIHRFTPSGDLIQSWGGVGTGAGEFHLPHCVVVDRERLLVADRENDRVQVFDLAGGHLASWTGFQRPTDVAVDPSSGRIYVTELARPLGNRGFLADTRDRHEAGRLAVLDPAGNLLARWGREPNGDMDGYFIAPHTVAVDSAGTVYVGEVTHTFGIASGYVGQEYSGHQLQRFGVVPVNDTTEGPVR